MIGWTIANERISALLFFLLRAILCVIGIKEESVDKTEDYCWNSIEELELPEAVFIEPMEKEEETSIDETKEEETLFYINIYFDSLAIHKFIILN
ncbi:Protein of unknown function [Gryllus bimaculatus]|nr:Protein of unknown function [Gryllus bimaculatus]